MPIYHVTTEGDEEGRTLKDLGYVEANDPRHAIEYLKSIGVYEYYIKETTSPIRQAAPSNQLVMWIANITPIPDSDRCYKGKVKENIELRLYKEATVQKKMQSAGLSYQDVIKFGKGMK